MSAPPAREDGGSFFADTLILAATERLARSLREDANLQRARGGAAVWEAPRVLSLSRWLIETWTASWPDAQLLSPVQELVLWREAVERDETGAQLLAPQAAAREARRTDQLLRRHAVDLDRSPAWQDEHHAFRRWRRQVERRRVQQQWITGADLAADVARRIAEGQIAVPQVVHLAGFVHPPSATEQAVLNALVERGVRLQALATAGPEPVRVTRHLLPDAESQWRFVAADLREHLAAVTSAELPPRVVIALPDPEAARGLGESVLRDLLAPWAIQGEGAQPWRWERGTRLSEHPLVDVLLAVLQLREHDNSPDLVSRVLLSSALWTEPQRVLTSAADLKLRDSSWPRVRLARLIEAVPEPLRVRFQRVAQVLATAPTRALPSQWAVHLRDLADALGWPGDEALDSASYQAVQSALALFDRLGTLDIPLGRVPPSTAREWFGELARAALFSPRVEHAQPVLITSIEEAASLSCDRLYVLDAVAAAVPPMARPTPFVAPETLRAAAVPEASPETWLARAQTQVARLLGGVAPEVCVCVPAVDARGALQQPSSLFGVASDFVRTQPARAIGALESTLSESSTVMRWPAQDPVPPVDAAEQAHLRPGSELFQAWFASPFFAFCRFRLGVHALPQVPRGLDARTQGTLVHRALESLWGELHDSAALAGLEESALSERVFAALDACLPALLPASEVGNATRALERARAHDVVLQWLRHERGRLDPFRVERRELPAQPEVAGLSLSLRLDRVDRVQTPLGERWLVIDYKTGREANPRGWEAERPSEPQLPLYASHAATLAAGIPQVDGICFGHVKDGHPALVAKTSWRKKLREEPVLDLAADWDEQLALWRLAMESAARGFLAGQAWLDPRVGDRSPFAELLALTGALPQEDESG